MVLFLQLAHKDSNLEMTESESVALPFGDGPLLVAEVFELFSSYPVDKCYYRASHQGLQPLF